MSVPTLTYFDVRGRAEPMVLAYHLSGTKFEHKKVSGEEFAAMKDKLPYGQLPVLEVDGKIYGESKAIASYVARTTKLAGKTDEDAMVVDAAFCLSASLMEAMGGILFAADDKEKSEKTKKLSEETSPKFMKLFENMINESGWITSTNAPTLGDLAIQDILVTLLGMVPTCLDDAPKSKKLKEAVEALPALKEYLAKRGDKPL